MTIARVLVVAGSDSGGGAGIQADIKAVTMMGGHAMTAITAITIQNTLGVSGVVPVPPDAIAAQMRAVIDDIGVDVIKTGMLGDAPTIEAVADVLARLDGHVPIVIDPVMVAKGGASLLAADAVNTLKRRLLPRATLVTPNIPELEALTGRTIVSAEDALDAARALGDELGAAVLAKGGHLEGDEVVDQLVTREDVHSWTDNRIETRHTHGTGCTLASAIAAGLGQGMALPDAVARARAYVRAAMLAAPGLGQGHGPLGHALGVVPFDRVKP
ncbi:bifunctional hydroxymethylpyrimidine kinase/phosphomethylpyrimidine kinase [Tardibacter chloracetimidivorans]|uniref:bifunctional hydroxymethylpyrimidine kinase/phosphomethylpyrimidine kinase n=1 Tax=Tardibacter chloracetimidivorans TaxID=1921510 RepID=UPI0009FAADE9|nr:bifunctional hydroxymethylpyrimidine kinase/phosphomethylpyrimidine kinase [Tardibacter chloracetimidivorans]